MIVSLKVIEKEYNAAEGSACGRDFDTFPRCFLIPFSAYPEAVEHLFYISFSEADEAWTQFHIGKDSLFH